MIPIIWSLRRNWGRCPLKVFTLWPSTAFRSCSSLLVLYSSLSLTYIYFIFLFLSYECMCMGVWVPAETIRGRQIPWSWSYRWLCPTWCGFWKLWSSVRAPSTLHMSLYFSVFKSHRNQSLGCLSVLFTPWWDVVAVSTYCSCSVSARDNNEGPCSLGSFPRIPWSPAQQWKDVHDLLFAAWLTK